MNFTRFLSFLTGAGVAWPLLLTLAVAQETPPPPPLEAPPTSEQSAADPAAVDEPPLRRLDVPAAASDEAVATPSEAAPEAETATPEPPDAPEAPRPPDRSSSPRNEMVRIWADALLPAGEEAGAIVAVMGSVVVDGIAHGETVAVMGDVTVNGESREAVGVMGSVTINGHVRGQVVAVMGDVQLGPSAVVDGEVVVVGGRLNRAPSAVVRGPVNQVGPFPFAVQAVESLRVWIHKCLVLGRPLAFDSRLLFFWGIAGVFAGIYLLIALLFNRSLIICSQTLDQRPGATIGVALLTALIAPLITILLSFIGVGVLLGLLLFLVGLYGKTAFLAWMGRRILQPLGVHHCFPAVLLATIVLLLLYTVPFVGFIVMKLTSVIGTGMVVYTVILVTRRPAATPALPPSPPPVPGEPVPVAPAGTEGVGTAPGAASGVAMPMSADPVMSAAGAMPPESQPQPVVPPPPQFSGSPPLLSPPPLDTPRSTAGASNKLQYSTLPRVGFWLRLAAAFLDAILIGIVANMISKGDYFPLIYAIYCVLLWALRGTTIGGIICGLKVVRLDDRPMDWTIAVVRALGGFLSLAVAGLGFIWVAFDKDRQSWHDKIAGTTIVRVPKGIALV